MSKQCYALIFESPVGGVSVAESDGEIIGIGMGTTESDSFEQALVRRGYVPQRRDTAILRKGQKQLVEYLAGRRRSFSLPYRLEGTEFQKAVWRTLSLIPYGETWSYGEVAAEVGRPKGARAVGQAVGSNQLGILIPCHRVIAADGGIGGFGCGLEAKRFLLKLERDHASTATG